MHGVLQGNPVARKTWSNDMLPRGASLAEICRCTLVVNLERYPPRALGILDEQEWDEIVRLRYERTVSTKPVLTYGQDCFR